MRGDGTKGAGRRGLATPPGRAARVALAAALASAALAGCTPAAGPGDAGPEDAGQGSLDAAGPDASPPPPGPDASLGPDAGASADGGAADGGAPDRDGDGLADAEDPAPDRFQALLFSDGFDDDRGGWIFSSVSMALAPGDGVLEVKALEPFEREGWIGPRPSWGDYLVRARLRVDAVGSSARPESGHAGVIARVSQVTPSRYVTCGVDLRQRRVVLAEHEGTRRTTLGATELAAAPGTWMRLRFQARGPALSCGIDGAEVTARSEVFLSGSIGFRSHDATFAADWIEVHEL